MALAGQIGNAAELVGLPFGESLARPLNEPPKHMGGDSDLAASDGNENHPAPNLNGRRLLAEKAAIHAIPLDFERTEQADIGRASRALNKGSFNELTNTVAAPCGDRSGGLVRPPIGSPESMLAGC